MPRSIGHAGRALWYSTVVSGPCRVCNQQLKHCMQWSGSSVFPTMCLQKHISSQVLWAACSLMKVFSMSLSHSSAQYFPSVVSAKLLVCHGFPLPVSCPIEQIRFVIIAINDLFDDSGNDFRSLTGFKAAGTSSTTPGQRDHLLPSLPQNHQRCGLRSRRAYEATELCP